MKFKPTDFSRHPGSWASWGEEAAAMANKVLEAYLTTLPRVYGTRTIVNGRGCHEPHILIPYEYSFSSSPSVFPGATHTTLLWGITEMERPELSFSAEDIEMLKIMKRQVNEAAAEFCTHEGVKKVETYPYPGSVTKISWECSKCGVKLKAKWEKI